MTESDIIQLYRLPDVMRLTGLSKTSIYRLAREGKFPVPVRIADSRSAWRSDEIQTWINDRPKGTRHLAQIR